MRKSVIAVQIYRKFNIFKFIAAVFLLYAYYPQVSSVCYADLLTERDLRLILLKMVF